MGLLTFNLGVAYVIPVLAVFVLEKVSSQACFWVCVLVGLEFQGWFLQRMRVRMVMPMEEGQDSDP